MLGFDSAIKSDMVFRDLVLAQIIEPIIKLDTIRVLSEVGVEPWRRPPLRVPDAEFTYAIAGFKASITAPER